ncbi:MAG: DUF6265 family protein [Planctomycetota bacterium]
MIHALIAALLFSFHPNHGTHTVHDLSFMVGAWRGEAPGGGVIDEVWMPAEGSNMTGAFRWMSAQGEISVQEIISLDNADGGPVYRLRHFGPNAGLRPWESEDESPLTLPSCEVDGNTVIWRSGDAYDAGVESATYSREGDTLTVTIKMHDGDGFSLNLERVE